MQCSFCGGEVNLSVGRCTKCGRMIDETSGIRLTRDIHELAERYGIKDEEEIQAEEEALPHLLHVKKNRAEEEETAPEDTGIVHSQGPTLGRGDYERLLSADEDIREDEDRPSYEDIRAERERLQRFDVRRLARTGDIGTLLDEFDEFGVLRDEVGLGVDFDDGSGLAVFGERELDEALGGDAAGLLRGLRKSFFAEQVDRLFHIAVGLDEDVLAIHHSGAGAFTEFLYHCGSNSHFLILL